MCFKRKVVPDMSLEDVIWWLEYDRHCHEEWITSGSATNGSYLEHMEWIAVFTECINWLKGKPSTMTYDKVIQSIISARATHEYALTQPESKILGDYQWQRDWIVVYDSTLKYLTAEN